MSESSSNRRGVFFWLIILLLVVLGIGVFCSGSMVFVASNEEFEEEFIREYCEELESQDKLEADVMNWCE